MQILKAGALYFALVFAAGFVLGTLRMLWVVPALGVRQAELLEAPIMLAVIVFTARWVVRRLALPPAPAMRVAVGLLALILLLGAEFGVALWLRGLSLGAYVAERDPVADAVYRVLLGVFALMPSLVARK